MGLRTHSLTPTKGITMTSRAPISRLKSVDVPATCPSSPPPSSSTLPLSSPSCYSSSSSATSSSTSSSSKRMMKTFMGYCILAQVMLANHLIFQVEGFKKVTQKGDILLGGIFPVHQKGKGTKYKCGLINKDRGIQRLEAMLFAIDKINQDEQILPHINLGAIILDTCSSDSYALNQSLEFIRASINTVEGSAFVCNDRSTPKPKYPSTQLISGVVGGSYSEVSLQVANLLRLFKIPQVSYASTGTSLSDKTRYDFFARTVPPDTFQALALMDVVQSFNWSYVSIVSSEGQYGDSGMKAFIHEARNRNICIAINEKVPNSATAAHFNQIFHHLLTKPNARAVILFVRMEDARGILRAAARAKNINFFTWVASDGWGKEEKLVEGVEEVAEGAITVELQTTKIEEFDTYFKSRTPENNKRNPWFNEYWEQMFSCKLPDEFDGSSGRDGDGDADGVGSPPAAAMPLISNTSSSFHALPFTSTARSYSRAHRPPSPATTTISHSFSSAASTSSFSSSPLGSSTVGHRFTTPNFEGEEGDPIKNETVPLCSSHLRIDESIGYSQETKVQFVVDAVYAFAKALHSAWWDLCRERSRICKELKEMDGGDFYKNYLLKVNFTAFSQVLRSRSFEIYRGNSSSLSSSPDIVGSQVRFDSRGDGLGRYNIYNYRKTIGPTRSSHKESEEGNLTSMSTSLSTSASATTLATSTSGSSTVMSSIYSTTTSSSSSMGYHYELIGRWFEDGLTLDKSKVLFNERTTDVPESVCSKPCKKGEIKAVQQGDHCCWICNPCRDQEYVIDEFTCEKCADGWWPHTNKSGCYQLPEQHMRWESIFAIIPSVTSVVGILLTLFVIRTFMKYIDTPIVKASGRELSFILLGGILISFLLSFILLAKPSIFICSLQRFGVGFGFSIIYGALLTKTNRISRIFDSARRSARRPSFISPKSQVIICMIFVLIQVIGTGIWFVLEPPATRHWFPDPNRKSDVILKCKVKETSVLISLIYNIFLITTCTIYAIKTRKIPENFNESKFIGFTMYTTCIIWLAFVPLFFGTGNNYEIQITTLCVSISLSAYVALFCLFSPKIYIILFHPDKNVRKLTMNSTTYKRALTSSTLATASNHGSVDQVKLMAIQGSSGMASEGRGSITRSSQDAAKDETSNLLKSGPAPLKSALKDTSGSGPADDMAERMKKQVEVAIFHENIERSKEESGNDSKKKKKKKEDVITTELEDEFQDDIEKKLRKKSSKKKGVPIILPLALSSTNVLPAPVPAPATMMKVSVHSSPTTKSNNNYTDNSSSSLHSTSSYSREDEAERRGNEDELAERETHVLLPATENQPMNQPMNSSSSSSISTVLHRGSVQISHFQQPQDEQGEDIDMDSRL